MSAAKHTPGPWVVTVECGAHVIRGASIPHNENGVEFEWRDYVASTWGGEHADNAGLLAAAPELLEALQWMEMFHPRDGEDSNARFERIAEVFHRDTGYLRPGKDCRVHSSDVRQLAWDAWLESNTSKARAAIAKALGEQP